MTYPLVQDLAADGIPVTVTCGLLGFSRQAFYAWRASPVSERDTVDAYATNAAYEIHRDDPGFGYRFIADELADAGHKVSERRVWKVCSQAGIISAHARKRGRSKKPGPPVHDDLVARDFTAPAPNRLWLTDITEHPTAEGKLYCCAIKDVFSNRIVGYSIADRMTAQLATGALRSAIARRQPDGTVVVHSDRGSQGELNRSSQHLDDGGERWRRCGSVSGRCSCIGGRCRRRGGRRSLVVGCGPCRRVAGAPRVKRKKGVQQVAMRDVEEGAASRAEAGARDSIGFDGQLGPAELAVSASDERERDPQVRRRGRRRRLGGRCGSHGDRLRGHVLPIDHEAPK